ncbi:bifunctional isocitrate dehydrogenase kinase/phosphatase [Idiomarina xiamenensis]|uniref:Isocitrate dehydrogenase kinase/phosphatase n=1 Tax=Idiomarina xiamenensis 10-D-4 TaxID=740709 RepID=K2KYS8_9GAMM|nr:bifunctional isocitrate dehydrogenase kinase/phosphatase [Idiomarina xiamenensis]EKE87674.1 bifunctional isocitrate dehydrogenase kinase/phosphatase protein [Idiomarina xiamenensis 10-D-4]
MSITALNSLDAGTIVQLILRGFQRHYTLFQALTQEVAEHFSKGRWQGIQKVSMARISCYDERVAETTQLLRKRMPTDDLDEALWRQVRLSYQQCLQFHPQAELAETFYNSVFCRLFERRYFNNDYIFVASTLADAIPLPLESEFRSYFPVVDGIANSLRKIIADSGLSNAFLDLTDDIKRLREAFMGRTLEADLAAHELRIDVLKAPFYRNKAAYIVGRIVTANRVYPVIVPILRRQDGQLFLDALITDAAQMAIIFGFARSYFFVDTRAPSALVRFLKQLMPNKTLAELYAAIGFHKQGKTEFYRQFLQHLQSTDELVVNAPGTKGLVMSVFTLPSFPYVFKVINDRFGHSKQIDRDTVIKRYRMVKQHDRVGRMADTLEFTDVAIPKQRFAPELLAELQQHAAMSLCYEDDLVVIRQLFVERRMIPLNVYLSYASQEDICAVMNDYGQALKDMLAANIFPGDMLLKNFGVTRQRRVVFYDYDEVRYLTDMQFRDIPEAQDDHQRYADEPWYTVGPDDVFPQQLATFALTDSNLRELFRANHAELLSAAYWQQQQQDIRAGQVADVFPYPQTLRFKRDA